MLVTLKKVLLDAEKGKYAVPAFNINNMEILQAIIRGAVKLKSPVIVQTSEGAIEYAGIDYLVAMVKVAAKAPIPVVLHLDHGKDMKIIKQTINSGYTSVMVDASILPYEQNVKKTKEVVRLAHKKGISVEAEIGAIQGIEDLVSVSEKEAFFTDPKQAKEFVDKTKCDALAISIGTAHGPCKFKGKPMLDFKRLQEIKKMVNIPLVLHGASQVDQKYVQKAKKYGAKLVNARGVSDVLLRHAIKLGIRKVNTDTDLRLAFNAALRETIAKDKTAYDPRKLLGPARDEIQRAVEHRIIVCGSRNKA
ncbi:class II fructose-1,6-bisphosphate aldolase [Candidatus Parcubacteria bacterium]|nr:class II fructose-1,6-bisphosphate aldolase [Patescibacteria group bacterium]MCG2694223.1 class II fructose-1,6-bisphosphate aldolase [Candidatus Parcubacteria bacterium]